MSERDELLRAELQSHPTALCACTHPDSIDPFFLVACAGELRVLTGDTGCPWRLSCGTMHETVHEIQYYARADTAITLEYDTVALQWCLVTYRTLHAALTQDTAGISIEAARYALDAHDALQGPMALAICSRSGLLAISMGACRGVSVWRCHSATGELRALLSIGCLWRASGDDSCGGSGVEAENARDIDYETASQRHKQQFMSNHEQDARAFLYTGACVALSVLGSTRDADTLATEGQRETHTDAHASSHVRADADIDIDENASTDMKSRNCVAACTMPPLIDIILACAAEDGRVCVYSSTRALGPSAFSRGPTNGVEWAAEICSNGLPQYVHAYSLSGISSEPHLNAAICTGGRGMKLWLRLSHHTEAFEMRQAAQRSPGDDGTDDRHDWHSKKLRVSAHSLATRPLLLHLAHMGSAGGAAAAASSTSGAAEALGASCHLALVSGAAVQVFNIAIAGGHSRTGALSWYESDDVAALAPARGEYNSDTDEDLEDGAESNSIHRNIGWSDECRGGASSALCPNGMHMATACSSADGDIVHAVTWEGELLTWALHGRALEVATAARKRTRTQQRASKRQPAALPAAILVARQRAPATTTSHTGMLKQRPPVQLAVCEVSSSALPFDCYLAMVPPCVGKPPRGMLEALALGPHPPLAHVSNASRDAEVSVMNLRGISRSLLSLHSPCILLLCPAIPRATMVLLANAAADADATAAMSAAARQIQHQRTCERPPLSDASAILQFVKQNIHSTSQWKTLLADLYGKTDARASLDSVLEHLVRVMAPHQLLQVLPSNGNARVFLPFLKRSYSGANTSHS